MGYTTPVTKSNGDGLTSGDWNTYVRDNFEAILEPPRCLVDHSVAQAIAHNTDTSVAFNAELFDNDGMHSTTSNNNRITAKTAGLYFMSTAVQFENNSTGKRTLSLRVNGSFTIATQETNAVSGGDTRLNVSTVYYLNENDYVEARVFQDSTVSLDVEVTTDSPNLRVAWLGG